MFALSLLATACNGNGGDEDTGTQEDTATGDTMADTGMDTAGGDTGGDAGPADTGGDTGGDAGPADTGADTGGEMMALTFEVPSASALPNLGDKLEYEGWLVDTSGDEPNPISTGKFDNPDGKTSWTWDVPASDVEAADKFVLSIEPQENDKPAPSATKYLAGPLESNSADLTTAPIGDLSNAGGEFLFNTPSDGEGSPEKGVWFLTPGDSPSKGLSDLAPLHNKGWIYEGWVVDTSGDSPKPYSTGKFADAENSWAKEDMDGAGPSGGSMGFPPFPGQDYVGSDPGGNDLTLNNGDYSVVISIEPWVKAAHRTDDTTLGDPSDKPFAPKPLKKPVPSGAETAPTTHSINNAAGDLPTGSVSISSK